MTDPDSERAVVREAVEADAAALARIYNHFIAHTVVTFEEQPIDASEMARRLADVRAASLPWLVVEHRGCLAGYAYATRWRPRAAYRHAVETTVYLAPELTGRGLGTLVYSRLLAALGEREVHAIIGGIALPNDASVALHEKLGFRKVAHFEQVGFKFNRWIDVGYWQIVP